MKKELIGLNRYLYTFNLNNEDKYIKYMQKLEHKGIITIVYINNGYSFEFKKNEVLL